MKVFVILMCCLVSYVGSAQEKRSMKSSQNGKSSPLLWLIINQLDKLDTKIVKIQEKTEVRQKQITEINKMIGQIQKENRGRRKQFSDINAKISVLQNDVRKLKSIDQCENGWKAYGNHCYLFGFNKINWHEAKKECERRHSHLVKIDNLAENSWLGSEFWATGHKEQKLWIGANDLVMEGKWTWVSDHSTINYTNWDQGEPSNGDGNEDCAMIYKRMTWNDEACSDALGYICEK